MYKIAILGCENSHADAFLKMIIEEKLYTDIEVVGVYSYDLEAANKLNEKFGVYVAESFDEFVGKVDGIVITARNGENHYKYAKPYIESGIPMFIDKPITNTIEDAESFKAELIKNNVKVSGGSSLKHPDKVAEFKKAVAEVVIDELRPVQAKYKELIENQDYLMSIINKGASYANEIAQKTLKDVYEKVGFVV